MCGLQYSDSNYTVIIDDDLEQNPQDIIRLYNEIKKGYDVVYGIIKDDKRTATRDFGSRMRDFLFNTLTNIPRNIKVSSFRIMKREILNKVVKYQTQFVYISLEILKHTNNIGNIDIVKYKESVSNYNLKKLTKLYFNMVANYSNLNILKKWHKIGKCYKIDTIINGEII
jgi:undecaprenyl-phosphate 4-deoxy-4-formamido-L-arabinose transferase